MAFRKNAISKISKNATSTEVGVFGHYFLELVRGHHICKS